MSLIVTSILVASGVLLGRYLARGRKAQQGPSEEEENERQRGKAAAGQGEKKSEEPLEGFDCKVGDVVMRSSGEEAWLAGALVLREQAPVAALFIAPEAGEDRAILARPKPTEELLWLKPVAPDVLGLVGREPPASLEHRSDRFERTRRIPVRVQRLGSGAPDVGETAIFAEYASLAGDRIVVVMGAKIAAFRGSAMGARTFTVLPSGDASD
jgi:hypothetical protein